MKTQRFAIATSLSTATTVSLTHDSGAGTCTSGRVTLLIHISHIIATGRITTVCSTRIRLRIIIRRSLVAFFDPSPDITVTAKGRLARASGAVGASVAIVGVAVVAFLGGWVARVCHGSCMAIAAPSWPASTTQTIGTKIEIVIIIIIANLI